MLMKVQQESSTREGGNVSSDQTRGEMPTCPPLSRAGVPAGIASSRLQAEANGLRADVAKLTN